MDATMKSPFPYFGGKSAIADDVWLALGQPAHYIEPFFGSGAVLLNRPNFNPTAHTESICDADGHIANVWRALQADPDAVAKVCDWPVNHADLIARKAKMIAEGASLLERLCADDAYFDTKLAGYWIWAASCWIGSGMLCPNQIPHIGDGGMGVHAKGKRPHIGNGGMGVHAKGQRPHIGDGGMGVHAKGKRPHLSHGGMGVHAKSKIPHIGHGGMGVHAKSKRPHIGHGGMGVHAKGQIPHIGNGGMGVQEPYNTNLYVWFRRLSERLRNVRVVCGDWTRVCGGNWQDNIGPCGLFLDPPYGTAATRDSNIYHVDSLTVAADVQAWCRDRGTNPNYRIVLAGYWEEHDSLIADGWTVHKWSAQGGYSSIATNGETNGNRHREALFFSPHCAGMGLFDAQG